MVYAKIDSDYGAKASVRHIEETVTKNAETYIKNTSQTTQDYSSSDKNRVEDHKSVIKVEENCGCSKKLKKRRK